MVVAPRTLLTGNCTEPRWFCSPAHPDLPAEGNSSRGVKHAARGYFRHIVPGPVIVVIVSDWRLALSSWRKLWWHTLFAQVLMQTGSSKPVNLSLTSLRAGQLPSPLSWLLGCCLTQFFLSPKKATSWSLDDFCFEFNNFLWQSPHDKFLRSVPIRACL